MNPAHNRVTIHEVAQDAGLSISTVSRVLSGSRTVTPEIAERVRLSADLLGYRVDSVGRSLRTQRTHTLGLVVPDITNPFFPALVQAIEHAARARGLGILIADADNDPTVELSALRTLIDRRVDAVLISPAHREDSRDGLAEAARTVPVVQLDRVIDDSIPYVRIDQASPVETIVSRLRSAGRRHFAFIGQHGSITTSREREDAFARLMRSHFPGEPLRVLRGRMTAESAGDGARELLERWPETDAIVCANDVIAIGVLQQLPESGARRVVAVSGFDDTLIASALRLTSVRQPVAELAELAIAAAEPDRATQSQTHVVVRSEVIFRQSTE